MPKAAVKNAEELPAVLTIDQVCSYLGISRPKGYELPYRKGFPVVRFGRALRVPRDGFLRWVEDQATKGGGNGQ